MTLKDELDASRNFKCKECDKEFVSQENLTKHKKAIHLNHHRLQLQLRLKDVARKISEQKLHLVNKISELRETEFSESQTCRCQGWCAINHTKHFFLAPKPLFAGARSQQTEFKCGPRLHCRERQNKSWETLICLINWAYRVI